MRIQPVVAQSLNKGNRANKSTKTQNFVQTPGITFNGNYARAFKEALRMPVRSHSQSCDVFCLLINAVKTENIVKSQAYRRFMEYTPGQFISIAARTPDTIIAETVEFSDHPLVQISDNVVLCHDPNSHDNIAFYYNSKYDTWAFQRQYSDSSCVVHSEQCLFRRNGKLDKRIISAIWNGGSSSRTEYFDSEGRETSFWGNLFK